jgi:hypothetical protein
MASKPPPTPPRGPRPPGSTPRRPGTPLRRSTPPRRSGFFVVRALRVLARPRGEWAAIGAHAMKPQSIYLGFLVPMAALGPAAATLGTILSGGERTTFAGTYTLATPSALLAGTLEYAFNLGAMWVLAWFIDRMAPVFQAKPSPLAALKVAAFGTTPYWVGSALAIVPKLAPVGVLLGLYSVWLYAIGLGPLMQAPEDRLVKYALVVGAGGLILVLLGSALLLMITS